MALWHIYTNLIFPASFLFGLFLVLTSLLGVDTGFHQCYVNYLIRVFEWCQRQAENSKARAQKKVSQSGDNATESDEEVPIPDNLYKKVVERVENQAVEEFKLDICMNYARVGCMAIIEDDVTKRFDSQHLICWNLLTRTNQSYNFDFTNPMLVVYFLVGILLRFGILLPIRFCIIVSGITFLLISTFLIGLLPEGKIKKYVYHRVSITAFRIMGRGLSIILKTHHNENRPRSGGICVANHTSPIDVIVLSCDNAYALVGQLQPGILGLLTRALSRAEHHVFFDRFKANDRAMVSQALQEHAADTQKLPILIFPEGTCINNSAVMMFKKGAFEASDTIFPVAIKYDSRFGDPFWNSSREGFGSYMLMMMTSWAIVCEAWYLPPMQRKSGESAADFAGRVKLEIARQGGLVDLDWDGQLKRANPNPKLKNKIQKLVADKLN